MSKRPRANPPNSDLPFEVKNDLLLKQEMRRRAFEERGRQGAETRELRRTLIPDECYLGMQDERLRRIYSDLKSIPLADYRVAVAATFRVFLELSFDEYLKTRELFGSTVSADDALAVKMKAAAADLYRRGELSPAASRALADAVESDRLAIVSAKTLEQFAHSRDGFPDSAELQETWDRLQAFFEQVWPR